MLGLNLATTGARTILPLLIGWMTSMSLLMLSLGFALHGLVIVAVVLWLGRDWSRESATAKTPEWQRELRDYGRPFVLLGVGTWALQHLDRFIAAHGFGLTAAGELQLALGLGVILPTMVVNLLMQLFFPAVFRQADAARTESDWRAIACRCDQMTAGLVVVSLAGLGVLHVIAPWLQGWLISAKYAGALPLLFPAGCAMLTMQVNQFQYLLLQGRHNSTGMVKVMLVVAGVKSVGAVIAAAISWSAFLGWMIASVPVCALIGRQMIRVMALTPGAKDAPEPGTAARSRTT
jgi:O-antigen/teichoic acid export membrane protein